MRDRLTELISKANEKYGVFWKTDYDNNWKRYYAWSHLYEDADYYLRDALDNTRCRAVKIVMRR